MMKINRLAHAALILLLVSCSGVTTGQVPPKEMQIKAAVQAAPEAKRDGAKVLGYNRSGDLVTLRKSADNNKSGSDLVCVADDPSDEKYHVACYHESLEPFMARGRELKREGKGRSGRDEIRRKEIESGQLSMPEQAAALYSLSGPSDAFDYEEGILMEAKRLYVVYLPNATGATTGLPTTPTGAGKPWLMEPGLPWAHIMISSDEKVGKRAGGKGVK